MQYRARETWTDLVHTVVHPTHIHFYPCLCTAVYDVTKRETFDDIEAIWLKEVDMYATVDDAIKMVVANKTDLAARRDVSAEEGHDLAKKHGCLFVETSAKTNVAVDQAFDELLNKVLETPALLGSNQPSGVKLSAQTANQGSVCYC
ncbi:P-loop containing nucleoside triphosphate hydrolase protein [Dunaliella salina]|uniref:P-loop containing nucleoside triphosphate hydrolase protein n=1 Tax=Dunaliella salina TaxID=3046 RepID=A0ABQ7GX66_DUNSA|nr:P-loop containing nucleoside triphosphate hydrolase protein [Dunaliella salina]|eukprot:KAF5839127.1 P-loop containing nucleoside triphosphate hydrolase protein [Dunaliella salina]